MQLKEAIYLYGRAINQNRAWGYSPTPLAEHLADGKIKVTAYHFESEWSERICATSEEVDFYLYTENSAVSVRSGGKHFEAQLALEEAGFTLRCTINGANVSLEEYKQAFPQEMKEDGEWLPSYWDGPGEWDTVV